MKILLSTLLFFFALTIYPQSQSEELLNFFLNEEGNIRIHDISNNGFIIFSETKNNNSKFYLLNPRQKDSQKLVFSTPYDRRNSINFSKNNNFIILKTVQYDKGIIEVLDITKSSKRTIVHPDGNIISANMLNDNKVLCQIRKIGTLPQIYLYTFADDTWKYITDGIGQVCALNSQWFFVNELDAVKNDLRQDLLSGKLSKKEYSQMKKNIKSNNSRHLIYSIDGRLLVDLGRNNQLVDIDWFPDSKKLVFREIWRYGFLYHLFF